MIILKSQEAALISAPGGCGAECANNAILAYSQIKLTSGLYKIVLIIFIEIWAITNFWVDTFTHPPSKLLQQILSTKKFNDSAVVMLTIASLRNRTAGRLRTAEWRKNVARDCAFPILRDIFSSFCRPESSSRPVA